MNQQQAKIVTEKNQKGDIIRRYNRGRLLGKGGFAKCYQLTSLEDGFTYAAKVVEKASLNKGRARLKLMNEIKLHKSLNNQNVVKYKRHFQDDENVYMLMQICTKNTLKDHLKAKKRLTEPQILFFLSQLLHALSYVHNCHIIHRDLKLGNLFLTEDNVLKLGDFGLAAKIEFHGQKKRTICGTPNYIAPQILQGKSGYSYQVDIWSVGIIIYTLFYGHPPFESADVKDTYRKIKLGHFQFPSSPVSFQLKTIIQRLLIKEPTLRPTIPQILQSQFFNKKQNRHSSPFLLTSNTFYKERETSTTKNTKILQDLKNRVQDGKRNRIITERVVELKNQNLTPRNKSQVRKQEDVKRKESKTSFHQPRNQNLAKSPELWRSPSTVMKGQEGGAITKWIDYSSKYGLGYLLSNGHCGVYFNDCTKIISNQTNLFYYISKSRQSKEQQVSLYSSDNAPADLSKKISLFVYFWQYLQHSKSANNSELTHNPYVKRWHRAKHAILFRLSNKTVQVVFVDHTEILISSENKSLNYKNKKGERKEYLLSEVNTSQNRQLIKRYQYTKDIFAEMTKAEDLKRH